MTICMKCLEKVPAKRYASAWTWRKIYGVSVPASRFARVPSLAGASLVRCRRRPLVAGLGFLSGLLAVMLIATVLVYNAWLQDALARAEDKTEQQRRQIVQLDINVGLEEKEHGESFKALVRYTEALRLDDGLPDQEREGSNAHCRAVAAMSTPAAIAR